MTIRKELNMRQHLDSLQSVKERQFGFFERKSSTK